MVMSYNHGMSHLDILLPFALPPPELARDLICALHTPALATLLVRSKTNRRQHLVLDEFARALPHETWLSSQFGLLPTTTDRGNSPPLAVAAMRALGMTVEQGIWFILHPAHIHIARDHLVLTDIRQVALSDADARQLFSAAESLFTEAGITLVYGTSDTWFLRADHWSDLQTSTPDAACGHNIDIWMPQGEGERNWRKLQNEVQMLWFTHPLNQQRQTNGLPVINALWLWGGAIAGSMPMTKNVDQYREAFNFPGCFSALNQYVQSSRTACRATDIITAAPGRGLLVLDDLIQPALTGEWSYWMQYLQTLEVDWLTPMLQALRDGKLDYLSLILTDNTRIHTVSTTRLSLKKFWIKSTLTGLLP